MEQNDLLILFSGGADSVLMLELAKKMNRKAFCLLMDYEQIHKNELDFAKKYLDKQKIPYKISAIFNLNVSSALTGSGVKGLYKNVSEWHVPFRNTIFLSLAGSVAESLGIEEIWLGADYSDRENLFIDCYQEYIVQINNLFSGLAASYPIKVHAPLLGFTKDMVLKMLDSFFISTNELFSGYGDLEKCQ